MDSLDRIRLEPADATVHVDGARGRCRPRRADEGAIAFGDRVDLQDIFVFERTGLTDAGKVQGRFRSTGVKPKILERLRVAGIELSPAVFDEVLEVNL